MNNNPFKYGAIVSGLYFTDREKEIKELITDFINGQHIIISSPRRYGKSSLVLKAMENAKSKGALGIYVDLFRASSKKRFAEIFSTAIARGTQSKISQVGRTLKEIIPSIIPKVVLKGEGEMEFDIEFGNRETDIDSLLDNMFDAPQKIALRKKKRVIVIFDEFQEIANFNGQQLQKVLRAKIQHHQQVTYCFLGSKRQLISELFLKQKSPFYRFGKMIELNKIPRSEMVKFIEKNFRKTQMVLKKDLIEEILDITDNHPYFIQMFCYELWNNCFRKGKVEISDLSYSLSRLLDNQSYAYVNIWESLSPKQKNLVMALSQGSYTHLQSQETVTRFELGTPATVNKNLKALEAHQILERTNREYRFADPFLGKWLLKK